MKKLSAFLLALLLVPAFGLSFIACGGDDDSDPVPAPVTKEVGKIHVAFPSQKASGVLLADEFESDTLGFKGKNYISKLPYAYKDSAYTFTTGEAFSFREFIDGDAVKAAYTGADNTDISDASKNKIAKIDKDALLEKLFVFEYMSDSDYSTVRMKGSNFYYDWNVMKYAYILTLADNAKVQYLCNESGLNFVTGVSGTGAAPSGVDSYEWNGSGYVNNGAYNFDTEGFVNDSCDKYILKKMYAWKGIADVMLFRKLDVVWNGTLSIRSAAGAWSGLFTRFELGAVEGSAVTYGSSFGLAGDEYITTSAGPQNRTAQALSVMTLTDETKITVADQTFTTAICLDEFTTKSGWVMNKNLWTITGDLTVYGYDKNGAEKNFTVAKDAVAEYVYLPAGDMLAKKDGSEYVYAPYKVALTGTTDAEFVGAYNSSSNTNGVPFPAYSSLGSNLPDNADNYLIWSRRTAGFGMPAEPIKYVPKGE